MTAKQVQSVIRRHLACVLREHRVCVVAKQDTRRSLAKIATMMLLARDAGAITQNGFEALYRNYLYCC